MQKALHTDDVQGFIFLTAPAAARTRDPKLRRLVLYPTELPEQ